MSTHAGTFVRRHRKLRGFTQRQLACCVRNVPPAKLGYPSRGTVSHWENGRCLVPMAPTLLRRLAIALDCSLLDLATSAARDRGSKRC